MTLTRAVVLTGWVLFAPVVASAQSSGLAPGAAPGAGSGLAPGAGGVAPLSPVAPAVPAPPGPLSPNLASPFPLTIAPTGTTPGGVPVTGVAPLPLGPVHRPFVPPPASVPHEPR